MMEVCAHCGRDRPGYIADPTCPKDGGPLYCSWSTRLPAARRNGVRIVAARPAVPAAHVAIAKLALERNDEKILSSVLDETFTFAGFVAEGGSYCLLVDNDGNVIGRLQPGDSLIDETAVEKGDASA
jgi:hypothetical protein